MAQLLIVEDHTFEPTDPDKAARWTPTTTHAAMFGPGLLCAGARTSVELYESGEVRRIARTLRWRHGALHEVTCSDCRSWAGPRLGGVQAGLDAAERA